MKFKIYVDKAGKWRWRMTAANGEIIGASSQGFVKKAACYTNATLLQEAFETVRDPV